jgi:hypothetical protein
MLTPEIAAAAARGWRLLPVQAHGKKPLVVGWPKTATNSPERLEAWTAQFPGCNWGMATGSGSGVFVLDVDGEPGISALHAFYERGRRLPDTLSVSTGRGTHHYFRWPVGKSISNSARKLAEGLDIRGRGGYVVIPPSVHSNGTQYAFLHPNMPIADAPEWLLQKIADSKVPVSPPMGEKLGTLFQGNRNESLFRYGCAMRRRGASLRELESGLLQVNARRCCPPLPDADVLQIAASAAKYPMGGQDPLETAWGTVPREAHMRRYKQFLELVRSLQFARRGLPIALPLERIGTLMGCDWTQVRRWRQKAVAEGFLEHIEKYVPHKLADTFIFVECPTKDVPLSRARTGLVVQLKDEFNKEVVWL